MNACITENLQTEKTVTIHLWYICCFTGSWYSTHKRLRNPAKDDATKKEIQDVILVKSLNSCNSIVTGYVLNLKLMSACVGQCSSTQ